MILVIDVGNSRIKWGFAEHGEIVAHGEEPHPTKLSAFAAQHWESHGRPTKIVVSNVSKQSLGDRIRQWAVRQWNVEPITVTSQKQYLGVTNGYVEPERLGSDRWAAMIAVRKLTREPALIIDCGTAITVDVLDGTGRHQGGLIIPGIETMRNALVAKTDRISLNPELTQAPGLLACDTNSAVMGGALYAAVATIDRITRDVLSELGSSASCFITGGDSRQLMPLLAHKYQHRGNLVLEGLVYLSTGEV